MKNIIKLYEFVFVKKEMKDEWTKWHKRGYHCINGFRRLIMVVLTMVIASVPAYLVREASPVVVHAAPEVQVVEKEVQVFPPMLKKICTAESNWQQFNKDGHVKRGTVNPSDVGICQINEPIWDDKAKDMKIDIFTEEGNKLMAQWLYNNYGTQPWNSSKCIPNGWGTKAECSK